jgi:BON domain
MALPGLITGAALGVLAMYVLDPEAGRRRRALARDKFVRLRTQTKRTAAVTARDVKNRAIGVVAEARGFVFGQETDDRPLEERVRSHLGFLVRHPSSIEVRAMEGRVILSGPVLSDEVQQLIRGVKSVRGVVEVENRLEVHDTPDQVPGLQGDVPRPTGQPLDLFQSRWSPSTRFSVGVVGTLLLLKLKLLRKSTAALASLAALGFLAAKACESGRSFVGSGSRASNAPRDGGWSE